MHDLVQFLRDRYDEDAAAASAAGDSWYGYKPEEQIAFVSKADARHIARHSPFRVLSDVAAKLDLLKLHGSATLHAGGGAQYFATLTVCRSCEPSHQFPEQSWPCPTLRLLARPYADHPDYREEWRP